MSLYIISTPIGNPGDITLRAVETLKEVDILICEELKIGRKLLKSLNIKKELLNLNEHNEKEETEEILQELLKGKTAALFSDCGTPLFADPGTYLVKRCIETGLRVIPIPGASSLLAALVTAGTQLDNFYYAGFLPRKSEERKIEIRKLIPYTCPVVIYDAPYRLKSLLVDLKAELPSFREISLALSLTQPDEKILYGTITEILQQLEPDIPKKEFVIILKPALIRKKSKKYVKKRRRR